MNQVKFRVISHQLMLLGVVTIIQPLKPYFIFAAETVKHVLLPLLHIINGLHLSIHESIS
jgi:hypothetical protein